MKHTSRLLFTIGLLVLFAISGCSRYRGRLQGNQPPAEVNNPPATTQPVSVQTEAPSEAAAPTPTEIQPQATLPPAPTRPAIVATAAPAAEVSQAADDLSKLLDGLSKDLDSTDTLNGVK